MLDLPGEIRQHDDESERRAEPQLPIEQVPAQRRERKRQNDGGDQRDRGVLARDGQPQQQADSPPQPSIFRAAQLEQHSQRERPEQDLETIGRENAEDAQVDRRHADTERCEELSKARGSQALGHPSGRKHGAGATQRRQQSHRRQRITQ